MLKFLDTFFIIFHTVFIIFNLTGWIFKKTRIINFFTLLITGISWFVLGIFYGFGYCFLTDWHFKILKEPGYNFLPDSYISFLIYRITGILPDQNIIDILTFAFFLFAFIISFYKNLSWLKKMLLRKNLTK